jgi:hypothetical protein
VGTCGVHNTQLQLSNPVLQLLGAGELGEKNLMQLLHSVYALQRSMHIEEWWQIVDMGVSNAKFFVEEGPPEATMANRWEDYVKFLRERKKKMGNNYRRLDMNKWNDELHFDRKIGKILFYKEWQPENANWTTRGDENGEEIADRCKLQEPVLSRWKAVGDASTQVSNPSYHCFFKYKLL